MRPYMSSVDLRHHDLHQAATQLHPQGVETPGVSHISALPSLLTPLLLHLTWCCF